MAGRQRPVGHLRVELVPTSAELWIDGQPAAASSERALAVGEHELEVRAPNYITSLRRVHIAGSQHIRVRVALQPARGALEQSQPDGARPSAAADQTRVWYKNPWLWTAFVSVVAAGAVGGGLVAKRQRDRDPAAEPLLSPNTPPNGVLNALWSR